MRGSAADCRPEGADGPLFLEVETGVEAIAVGRGQLCFVDSFGSLECFGSANIAEVLCSEDAGQFLVDVVA